MKTLVIHPTDPTTAFLSVIYEGKGWEVITSPSPGNYIIDQIKKHDRIIMLGHGTSAGLIGGQGFIINSKHVYLLRDKLCICIWYNADEFVKNYNLKGFHTGMIISDWEEALMFCLHQCKPNQVVDSNILFADSVMKSIDSDDILSSMHKNYNGDSNPIIAFNRDNLYN